MKTDFSWSADSVGGVIFPSPGQPQRDAFSLWSHVFDGQTPNTFQRATTSPIAPTMAAGVQGSYGVQISAQVGRIDIALTQPPTDFLSEMPRIGDVTDATLQLTKMILGVCGSQVPVRAAIILDLAQSVSSEDRDAAFAAIIPHVKFPSGSIDTLYQFNVRRQSRFSTSLAINRLRTFSTGEAGMMNIPAQPGSTPLFSLTPFIGLKVDVNTAPDARIQDGSLSDLLGELRQEALDIMADPFRENP